MSIVKLSLTYIFVVSTINAASIGGVVATPRINSGNQLLLSITTDCFTASFFDCINQKVLDYVSFIAGEPSQDSRSYNNVDEAIGSRVGRILATNQITLELPKSIFEGAAIVYRPDDGFDVAIPRDQGRGLLLKKKLLLPVLLLLKLKMKALMPIIVALIGFKATKALILSKIAIKLVLGFLIYQLIQKLGGMKMSMMPMMPMQSTEPPMSVYGAPVASTPPSSYEPSSWEPSGGPYARVWEPSNAASAQSLAYSSYVPNNSGLSTSSSSS